MPESLFTVLLVGGTMTAISTGFTTSFGNGLLGGQNFGHALWSGAKSGVIGGVSGAFIGGSIEWIRNQEQLGAFRIGNNELGINGGDPVPANDAFLSEAQKAWYKEAPMDKIKNFTTEKIPSDVSMVDKFGNPGLGKTVPIRSNGKITGISDVYFSKLAFSSAKSLFYTMGHEFVHVSQFAALSGLPSSLITEDFISMLEFHAYGYESTLGKYISPNLFSKSEIVSFYKNSYFSSMSYTNFSWTTKSSFSYPFN